MGNKNLEKSHKIELNSEKFVVKSQAVDTLFYGKTPGYEKRFKAWARNTSGEHLDNLIDALLSNIAFTIAKGSSQRSDERLRGQVDGYLIIQDIIRQHASETKPLPNETVGDLTDLLN